MITGLRKNTVTYVSIGTPDSELPLRSEIDNTMDWLDNPRIGYGSVGVSGLSDDIRLFLVLYFLHNWSFSCIILSVSRRFHGGEEEAYKPLPLPQEQGNQLTNHQTTLLYLFATNVANRVLLSAELVRGGMQLYAATWECGHVWHHETSNQIRDSSYWGNI